MKVALNTAIGTRDLCAWQPVPGVTWVQTRLPEHANRLAKRRDGRLVVRGMAGGYLKTFEFRHPLSWAERLIRRYTRQDHTRQDHTANARSTAPTSPASGSDGAGGVTVAGSSNRRMERAGI